MFSRILAIFLICFALVGMAQAEKLDRKRYVGIDEIKPGMTGIGKTVLRGTKPVEFFAEVISIIHNFGPKQDVIIARLSGAGLEKTGVIEGMSGSPVYFDGRLAGAVAFAWAYGKEPIAGIQPIEQMLAISDEHAWRESGGAAEAGEKTASVLPPALMTLSPPAAPKGPFSASAEAVPTTGVSGQAGEQALSLRPIRTPVMASGAAPTVLKFLRKYLMPYGLVPVQGGGAGGKSEERAAEGKNEKLQPGSVLCISLMSGDLDLTASGTVTEVRDDKIYGFGHSFMGMGEADYPMSVGEALFVYPSRYISFRVGAPLKEVGRLTWDEMAGVVGRVGPKRSRMVPVEVEVLGPDDKSRRVYKYRVIHHRLLSSSLVTTAFINSLFARSALPQDVTLRYSVRIEIDGHEPVVLENISSGPSSMFMIMIQIMGTTSLLMNNAIEPLRLKAVQTKIEVIPKTRLSIIRSVRALKNAVRPGQSMPVEIILRTYRGPDVRLVEDVPIPADLPNGTYRLTVCGGSENLREEMREMPGRYNPRTISDMLWILRRDEPMDNLFFRLHLPAGKGLAIEGSELPNLPGSISAIIGQTGREVSSIRQPRVTRKQLDMLLSGFRNVMIPVDDRAPRN